jgi:hypothetical protein
MGQWQHGGGFSVDASVRIEAADRAGRERLLRYCARPPFALDRLRELRSRTLALRGRQTWSERERPARRSSPKCPDQPTAAESRPLTRAIEPPNTRARVIEMPIQNLTMRMHMRRFTRLTNGFSKKMANHACAVALHYMFYNFAKIHKTLRVTPAMQAGISDHVWTLEDIAKLAD